MIYPHDTPIILTDKIYQTYNGNMVSPPETREIGYWLAEEAISRDLDTYLLPTTITGTYPYAPYIMLDTAHVIQIFTTDFLDNLNNVYYTVTGSFNQYLRIQSDTYGVLDVDYIGASCGACGGRYPYQVRTVYQSGLVSGTSYRPNVLVALTQTATLFINELQGWGNEGVGDIGITRFSNQQYSEQRMAMINTVYGNSAKAQFIHRQLAGLRKYRYAGI